MTAVVSLALMFAVVYLEIRIYLNRLPAQATEGTGP